LYFQAKKDIRLNIVRVFILYLWKFSIAV
jgi:hypothetical protein